MEQKINIAELLKDCPKGMELDCILFDNDVKVIFDGVDGINTCASIIKIVVIHDNNRISHALTKYGQWNPYKYAKCVIFPKGKTTWEGFTPPCKFKDGDIVISDKGDIHLLRTKDSSYCAYRKSRGKFPAFDSTPTIRVKVVRLATEEEKQKLFDAIKSNGYEWKEETKTLEKLVGPKFKVGDRIVKRNSITTSLIVSSVSSEYYGLKLSEGVEGIGVLPVSEQDDYEFVPNKFDITTLVPFESKVLVRDKNNDKWIGQFFSHYDNGSDRPYVCIGIEGLCEYKKCIPFKNNEYLLGKTDDCNEYYKTWC